MDHAGDEFAHRVAPADGNPAHFEMRAFGQRNFDFHAAEMRARDHAEQFIPRTLADRDAQARQARAIGIAVLVLDHQRFAKGFARRDIDRAPVA